MPLPATSRRRLLPLAAMVATVAAFGLRGADDTAPRDPGAPAADAAPAAIADVATPAPTTAPASPARAAAAPGAALPTASTSSPRAAAGMRVFVDPETGELAPAPAGLAEFESESALNDDTEGLVEVELPDGSYMVDLAGRFQQYTVVSLGPDGRIVRHCGVHPARLHRHAGCAPAVVEE